MRSTVRRCPLFFRRFVPIAEQLIVKSVQSIQTDSMDMVMVRFYTHEVLGRIGHFPEDAKYDVMSLNAD